PPRKPGCGVVTLPPVHQPGVAAPCLDHCGDGGGVAAGVGADEAVRQMSLLRPLATPLLDGVLLDQDPLVAAVPQGLDELVSDVRLVGEGHLGGREATYPAQRLEPEDRR